MPWEVCFIIIPSRFYHNDTSYRNLTPNPHQGNIGCGFMFKPDASFSDSLRFKHYGALYLLSGRGLYEDEYGRRIPLYPGNYIQRLPGVSHSSTVYSTGDWLEFFICFDAETYEHLAALDLLSREPVIHPGLSSALFQQSIYLLDCMKKWPNEKLPFLYLQLQEFAISLFQRSLHKQMDPGTQILMQKASELLCTPPDFPSAQKVASDLELSYESFRKKFKQYFRSSPAAYQLNSRINYSKMLLINTDKPLNEIALLCHFSDAFAFSKAFKKQYGISPSHFRMMYLL